MENQTCNLLVFSIVLSKGWSARHIRGVSKELTIMHRVVAKLECEANRTLSLAFEKHHYRLQKKQQMY